MHQHQSRDSGTLTRSFVKNNLHILREAIKVPESILRARLTYALPTGQDLCLLDANLTHYVLPRHAMSEDEIASLGAHVDDLRPSSFARSHLRKKQTTTLRDEAQQRAWSALSKVNNGTLALACGRGKTVLALMYAEMRGIPVLIVAPQRAHLENWEAEIHARFDIPVDKVAWVGEKKKPWPIVDVALATVQGLANAVAADTVPTEFWKHYGLVIFDECHHMSAAHFVLAVNAACGDRLGLTATVRRADAQHGIFLAHIGQVFHDDTKQDLIPDVFPLILHTVLTPEQEKRTKDSGGATHLGLLNREVGLIPERNDRIVKFILELEKRKRVVFALSHSVDQVKELARLYALEGRECGLICGETQDRLEQLNNYQVVFATIGVAAEAYNRVDIDTVVFLTPMRAQKQEGHVVATAMIQGGGRALRPLPGKTPRVYILCDSGIKQYKSLARSMLRAATDIGWRVHDGRNRRTVRDGG